MATVPRIVAPVSRFLSVADIERSVTFYREVLGFQAAGPLELVSGPARVQLTTEEVARDSTLAPRPRGAALVFFETDDVLGLREAFRARGGAPSEIEKVNWLKMQMFQIADPDGHTLWFGASFQEPGVPPDPHGQLIELLPELPLSGVPAGIAYYQEVLGFKINYAQDDLGVMYRDAVTLCLIARTARHTGIGSCEAYVRDADALYAELKERGADLQGEPVSRPWGLRDFRVHDLEGNRITFAQPFE